MSSINKCVYTDAPTGSCVLKHPSANTFEIWCQNGPASYVPIISVEGTFYTNMLSGAGINAGSGNLACNSSLGANITTTETLWGATVNATSALQQNGENVALKPFCAGRVSSAAT